MEQSVIFKKFKGKRIYVPRSGNKIIIPPTDEEVNVFLKQLNMNGWLNDRRVKELGKASLVALIDACLEPELMGRKEVNFEVYKEGKRDRTVLLPPFLLAENGDLSVNGELRRGTEYLESALLPFYDDGKPISVDEFVYEIDNVEITKCSDQGKVIAADLTLKLRTNTGKNDRRRQGSLDYFVNETVPNLKPGKPAVKALTEFFSVYTKNNNLNDAQKILTVHFLNNLITMLINNEQRQAHSSYPAELFSVQNKPIKVKKVVTQSLEGKMFSSWFNYALKKVYETKNIKTFTQMFKTFPEECRKYGLRTDFLDKDYLEIKLYNVPLIVRS